MASERVRESGLSSAERNRLIAENNRLRQELRERYGLSNIVGNSRAMRLVCEQIGQVSRARGHVLLRGEPGTGKALIARAIHHNSSRSQRPFIRLACAGMSDAAADSQLAGGTRAAAVVTTTTLRGWLQRAGAGTLFLDEVGGLGLQAQDELLTDVRERVFERSGRGGVRTDVRLIAGTSLDLDDLVTAGSFRHDLYQRLSALCISIPPLRERKADLPMLVDLLVEKFAREHARRVSGFSSRAMDMLLAYDWPGNVRELSVVVERAVVVTAGPVMHQHALPSAIHEVARSSVAAPLALSEALDAFEGELLRDALRQARGVRSQAARLLGTTERIFNYKLRKHGIDSRLFKVTG